MGASDQLRDLAIRVNALESTDVSDFQRKARILQSLWRIEQGLACGIHRGKYGDRPLGSRLLMPDAQINLTNYLTENIRNIVRQELEQASVAKEKLYGEPRIYNDLLSSQPLCFNLFGELACDLALASSFVLTMSDGRFSRVTSIEFEYSPGRSNPEYLADRSAFDVFIRCETADGLPGFISIEVKYHENLMGPPSSHKQRYDEVSELMGCFSESKQNLKKSPLQQIWRDHLLAGVTKETDGYHDALFVVLYPRENNHVSEAVERYIQELKNSSSFTAWTLEDVICTLRQLTTSEWVSLFNNRYLDFDRIYKA